MAERREGTVSPVIRTALVLLFAAGILGGLYMQRQIHDFQAQLALRPPMMVVRLSDMVKDLPPKPSETRLAEVLRKYDQKIGRLASAGYVVLDAQAVAGAPEEFYVEH